MQPTHILPVELTIYAVAEWHARFQAWLADAEAGGHDLRVDASTLREVDAAGVQLLTALANSLAGRDARLLLAQPSAALTEACSELGADFLLHAAREAA